MMAVSDNHCFTGRVVGGYEGENVYSLLCNTHTSVVQHVFTIMGSEF